MKGVTLLDMKNEPYPPHVEIGLESGEWTVISAPDSGTNGIYTLPFKTGLYPRVKILFVHMAHQGAVSSIEYPYCAKTPTTKISLKKYAGPAGRCGVGGMQDHNYVVPRKTH